MTVVAREASITGRHVPAGADADGHPPASPASMAERIAPSTGASPRDGASGARARSLRRAMWMVGLVVALAAALGLPARATPGGQVTADEPQYLLTADALGRTGDLDIGPGLRAEDWRAYHREWDLPTQTAALPGGQRLSPHDPGLPVLLAAPMRLGGWMGAKLALAAMAGALAATLVWIAVRRFAVPTGVAATVVGCFGVVPPLVAYGTQVYPELPAALAVAVAMAALTGPAGRRTTACWVVAVVVLPWLAVKYAPVAGALGLAGLIAAVRAKETRLAVGAAGALVLAGATYLMVHQAVYGGWTVYAVGDHFAGGELTVVGESPDYVARAGRLVGLLTDRDFGLLAWAPAYLVAVPALAALARRRPPGWLVLVVPLAVGWLNAAIVALTMHGWWWPGRQVVVVLPCLVLAAAWWIGQASSVLSSGATKYGRPGAQNYWGPVLSSETTRSVRPGAQNGRSGRRRGWLGPLFVAATAFGVLAWSWLAAEVALGDRTVVYDFAGTTNPLSRAWRLLLPDLRVFGAGDVARQLAWVAVLAVMAGLAWRHAEPGRRPNPDQEHDRPDPTRPDAIPNDDPTPTTTTSTRTDPAVKRFPHYPGVAIGVAILVFLGAASGCAKDDGAATRSECGGSASGSAAGGASATGSASGRPLKLTLDEYTVKAPATTKRGKVLLTARNVGEITHEIVVIKGVTVDDVPTQADGAIDEEKLPKGALLGEVEGITAGATCDGGFDLDPGTYTLACNLVSNEGGKERVHFMRGMSTVIEVK